MIQLSTQNPNEQVSVVWQAIPGTSQEDAIDSRAHHTLYYGTRGPGKTLTQLMRFRRRVGLGYGAHWRGMILDREFKNLEDIVTQGNRFFPKFNDGVKFYKTAQSYKWSWPTGEELLLRHAKDAEDYQKFHGHEYCLAVGQKVVLDKGNTPIENVRVGDMILTPKGYRRVNRVLPRRVRPCISTSFYDKDSRLISSQVTSISHRTLTTDGWQNLQSGVSNSNTLLCPEVIHRSQAFDKSHACGHPVNPANYAFQSSAENSAIESGTSIQVSLQSADLTNSWLVALRRLLLCAKSRLAANEFRALCKSFLQFDLHKAGYPWLRSGLRRLYEQVLLTQRRLVLNWNASLRYVRDEIRKVSGYHDDYLTCLCLCDELLHTGIENVRSFVPSRSDVPSTNLGMPWGDSVIEFEHNRLSSYEYEHPYTGKREKSILGLSVVSSQSESCGYLETIDIEVEDANCYISSAGVINKNCFIGWNELTKHPTPELYLKLMSVNRTSFLPEEHTPHDIIAGKKVYHTPDGKPLPDILLEVFSTTNTSGPGHHWVKDTFIDVAPVGTLHRKKFEVYNPRTQQEEEIERTQIAIFGSYKENIYLTPDYIASLNQLTANNENLRKSWLCGSWEVGSGGAFDDCWEKRCHVIKPFFIPSGWKVDRSFDWGSSTPYAVNFWAESNGEEFIDGYGVRRCVPRGSLFCISEIYGGMKIGYNQGLRQSGYEIANIINVKERDLVLSRLITSLPMAGPGDNQIREVRNVDEMTIADKMASQGIHWTSSDKSPGSRIVGLGIARDMLKAARDGIDQPHLYFFEGCRASIATMTALPMDEDKPEDASTEGDDHHWDSVRYRCLKSNYRYARKIRTLYARSS